MCALAAAFSSATYAYDGWNCSDGTPTISVCDWSGVYCYYDSIEIYYIGLGYGGVQGSLPTEIGLLTSLVYLDLIVIL